jgi:hypothetical protein
VSIPQAVANGGYMGCLRWLAEARDSDVQHVALERHSYIGLEGELANQLKHELERVQRAQRQRHAARAAAV